MAQHVGAAGVLVGALPLNVRRSLSVFFHCRIVAPRRRSRLRGGVDATHGLSGLRVEDAGSASAMAATWMRC
jgi:hypothetical protein